MAKLITATKTKGKLVSITLAINRAEVPIYDTLIKSEFPDMKCTACGAIMNINPDNMRLIIDNPLYQSNVGFETAIPEFYCNCCNKRHRFTMIDMAPFTSELNFLSALRNRYKKLKEKKV